MFFHVILTSDCNMQCKYCFGEGLEDFDEDFGDDIEVDYDLPRKLNYDLDFAQRLLPQKTRTPFIRLQVVYLFFVENHTVVP
jgi:hypothetical protein